jgi:hypothetical protein
MEAKKAVKIGAQEQDVADLSQVGSNECPQGETVEAKIVIAYFMQEINTHPTIVKISNIST